MCLVSLGLLAPNKIWPVLTFPHPGFSKFIGVRFAQPQGTNHIYIYIYIWLVSFGLVHTDFLGLLSLSLVSQKLVASRHQRVQKSRFTRPLEPNQVSVSFPLAFWTQTNFDMVYFPSAWFLQNLLGYVSLSFTASTCREESFHLALRT